MKVDARALAIGAGAAVAAFFVMRGGGGSGSAGGDPTRAIPRESFLAATVDLAELRRSPVYDALFGAGGESALPGKALGIGKLANACGFDPLARVSTLSISVPEEGDTGEFGIAAKIDVSREELERCTKGVSASASEPKAVGDFYVVEDTSGSGAARPKIGYGKGGLLVAGRGTWFDAILAAAEGNKPGIEASKEHAAIRRSLTNRDGWRAPAVALSALLPTSLRERLRKEMRAELGASDPSSAAMGGVLGVSGVGLALRTGARIDAAVELVCDTPDACAAVEKLIHKKKFDLSKELSLRMIGLGPVIESIQTSPEDGGKRLRVTAGSDAKALAATIERVSRLKSFGSRPGAQQREPLPTLPAAAPEPKPIAPISPISPDETLRPKERGGHADAAAKSPL